ncbi:hypothetical protein EG328_005168 [Venturia inaequalis]|uniref:Uncharacterized protein n=1 Tax=Venturia inaequalis TaxID=5025 RepID=A0A8H3UP15_VENIN|nr:hypothetical protein EG328_005168 [Venturia inaequalis]
MESWTLDLGPSLSRHNTTMQKTKSPMATTTGHPRCPRPEGGTAEQRTLSCAILGPRAPPVPSSVRRDMESAGLQTSTDAGLLEAKRSSGRWHHAAAAAGAGAGAATAG